MLKDKYEISLWEDYIVKAIKDGIPEHYEERKLAVIGSDTMEAQFRAIEPKLVENINGTNTLTFKMYYTYIDNITGEKLDNPFMKLLINERKIKVLWKNKWYDLVIKNIQEDSSGKSITYTCKDLYINELSKTGFDLEFDNELQNNQGTTQELGAKVLEGTDWTVDKGDTIQQKIQEPVYALTGVEIVNGFTAVNILDGTTKDIKNTDTILVFYSVVQNKAPYLQFLYAEDGKFTTEVGTQLVVNGMNLGVEGVTWSEDNEDNICAAIGTNQILKISKTKNVSESYRGERLVRSQKQEFDPLIGQYVYVYKNDKDAKVYGYTETVYRDPTTVNNLLVNYENFSNTTGWSGGEVQFGLYPKFSADSNVADYSATSYLKLSSGTYFNSGIQKTISFLDNGFQKGQKYIVRIRALANDNSNDNDEPAFDSESNKIYITPNDDLSLTPSVEYKNGEDIGTCFSVVKKTELVDNWIEYTLTCNHSIAKSEIISKEVRFRLDSNGTCWLEQIQFYPEVFGSIVKDNTADANGNTTDADDKPIRINPGEMDRQSIAQVRYRYYLADHSFVNKDDLEYLYDGLTEWEESGLKPQYNDNFEKIRSIQAKNSNRFNLLQTIAETFECWVRFNIEHDETGRVIYDGARPKKYVTFLNNVGQETGIGFIYGIDLKTISRTINSDQITSKVIVKLNNNEYAKDGFCTIARSKENYARDTFILNFDYYINQGLLDGNVLNKDLYLSTDSIGYYYYLNKYNTEYDAIKVELKAKELELTKQQSLLEVYKQYIVSMEEEITSLESKIMNLAGVSSWEKTTAYIKANPDSTTVTSSMNTRSNIIKSLENYYTQEDALKTSIGNLQDYIKTKKDKLDEILTNIENLHEKFYQKYSRFIQEGSWTSEEYIDDNLYYLDALSVAYTSSRPKISYNISVLRLSALEEFKNKVFHLGDISFIQDTEFFGYTTVDGIKTPYKEKVLVSEVTSNFDSPEKDTFKVQNYKTQFEDLFQRITATTQSLQYASGEYQRAANAFTPTGEINAITLQNSFSLNQDLVISAQNDSVVTDSTGITVTDISNPNNKTKITSGGVFLSTDGGVTWKSGVRGEGISAQYLTSGSINTNNITIMDGNHSTFRWDSAGINAYSHNDDIGTVLNKFVRFDQFGLYGINGWSSNDGTSFVPAGEDDVWDNANFALTWKGFLLRNKIGDGYIEISTDNDIQLNDGKHDRIRIGRLPGSGDYGIRINNSTGATVMETDSDGALWLKERLNIGTNTGTKVGIGKLDPQSESGNTVGRVIDANSKFIVYEDGSMVAKDGTFTGTINATGGQIGGLSIDSIIQGVGRATIKATATSFINNSPETITLTAVLAGVSQTEAEGLKYEWQKGGDVISGANSATLTINNIDFGNSGYKVYKVIITKDDVKYEDTITISKEVLEVEPTLYELEVSGNEILKFMDKKNGITLSPQSLIFKIWKLGEGRTQGRFFDETETEKAEFDLIINYYSNTDGIYSYNNKTNLIDLFGKKYFYQHYIGGGVNDDTRVPLQDYVLDLEKFLLASSETESDSESFREYLKNENEEGFFKFIVNHKGSNRQAAIAILNYSFGTSSEMATFNLHAGGFNAAVDKSVLEFSSDGLRIKNGGLTIYEEDEKVLYAENGNLVLSGYIQAKGGTIGGFTINETSISSDSGKLTLNGGEGTLIAQAGTIGGFTIESNTLISNDGNLTLYGDKGHIDANSINLGIGATIDDYIELGEAYLYNPEKHNGQILNAGNGNVYLTETGELQIGHLKFDGAQSSITDEEGMWVINGDGSAIFDNITLNSANIGYTVLKEDTVQAVSSTMIFQTSSRLKTFEAMSEHFETEETRESSETREGIEDDFVGITKLILENEITLELDDYVYIVNGKGAPGFAKVVQVEEKTVDEEVITEYSIRFINEGNFVLDAETILTKLGHEDQYTFAITSGETFYHDEISRLVHQNSLTIAKIPNIEEANVDENTGKKQPEFERVLVLGKLNGLKALKDIEDYTEDAPDRFGLYAKDVFLTGSLTTQFDSTDKQNGIRYAGINTLNGATANKFENDSSRIIIWAGSKDTTKEEISKSPFQVTENGSLYAAQGFFEGSILTKSYIESSYIETSEIHGIGDIPALKIYDTGAGIAFFEKVNEFDVDKIEGDIEDRETLRIGNYGLAIKEGQKQFISISDDEIFFKGKEILTEGKIITTTEGNIKKDNSYALSMRDLSIGLRQIEQEGNENDDMLSFISFGLNDMSFKFSNGGNEDKATTAVQIGNNSTIINSEIATVAKKVVFGNIQDSGKIEFEPVSNGYNIYVS